MIKASEAKKISEAVNKPPNRQDYNQKLKTIEKTIKKACEKGKKSITYGAYICQTISETLYRNGYTIRYSTAHNPEYKFGHNPKYDITKYGDLKKETETSRYSSTISWG